MCGAVGYPFCAHQTLRVIQIEIQTISKKSFLSVIWLSAVKNHDLTSRISKKLYLSEVQVFLAPLAVV